jgi:hypothetical protein
MITWISGTETYKPVEKVLMNFLVSSKILILSIYNGTFV